MPVEAYKIGIAHRRPAVVHRLAKEFEHRAAIWNQGLASRHAQLLQLLKKQEVDMLLYDPALPGLYYLSLLKSIFIQYPFVKVIALTDFPIKELMDDLEMIGVHGICGTDTEAAKMIELMDKINQQSNDNTFEPLPALSAQDFLLHFDHDKFDTDDKRFVRSFLLTRREKEILILVSRGLRNREIADQLYISKRTVETHRENIMQKLSFENAAEMIRFAVRLGF